MRQPAFVLAGLIAPRLFEALWGLALADLFLQFLP